MKKRKVIISILLCFVLFSTAISVSAYSVGDTIQFNANNIQTETDGFTNNYTRTEEEQFMDNTNWSNNNQISDVYRDFTTQIDENSESYVTVLPDRMIVTQNVPIAVNELVPLTYLAYEYYSGGYGYDIDNSNGYYDNSVDYNMSLSEEDIDELIRIAGVYGFDYYNSDYVNSNFNPLSSGKTYPGKLTPVERTQLVQQLRIMNSTETREIELGNKDIIDFNNYPERLVALDIFLDAIGQSDEVMTQRIIEIRVNTKSESVLWQSVPQTWGVTGQTHFWEFECVESYDNMYHAPLTMFGSSRVNQTFYFPGKYHVTATQILNQKYCEAISYDVNEYWIVADTGQVIYKYESDGAYIDDTDKPLSEQDLYQVSCTKIIDEGTYYVPVLDQIVTVNRGSWDFNMDAPSVWGYSFNSQRIE